MEVRVGDMFQAVFRQRDPQGKATDPIELYRMQILRVDGESIVYRREGGKPAEITRTILQAALERGDVVKITTEDSE